LALTQNITDFIEHGVVFDLDNKETVSMLVWADTAFAFATLGQHLLVFTKNFIEVRHKECIWQIKQLISTPDLTVLNADDHHIVVNNQIFCVNAVPQ